MVDTTPINSTTIICNNSNITTTDRRGVKTMKTRGVKSRSLLSTTRDYRMCLLRNWQTFGVIKVRLLMEHSEAVMRDGRLQVTKCCKGDFKNRLARIYNYHYIGNLPRDQLFNTMKKSII